MLARCAEFAEPLKVTLAFFEAIDSRDHDAAALLFSSDCIWKRQDHHIVGRDAVTRELRSRDPLRKTLHLVTGVSLDRRDAGRAAVNYVLLAFVEVLPGNPSKEGQRWIKAFRVRDELAKGESGCWEITSKEALPVLDWGLLAEARP